MSKAAWFFSFGAMLCAYIAFACAHGSVNPFEALWKRYVKALLSVLHVAALWIDLKFLGSTEPSVFMNSLLLGVSSVPAIAGMATAVVQRKGRSLRTMDRRQPELAVN